MYAIILLRFIAKLFLKNLNYKIFNIFKYFNGSQFFLILWIMMKK